MTNSSNFSLFNDYEKCSTTNGLIRYFGSFIFVLGIVSTLLSIGVFTRKPLRRKSCCFYFMILAISDSIHLLTMVIEHLPYSFSTDFLIIHTNICKIIIFLIYFSNHLSNVTLAFASIDRFILIYCPSRSKRFCNIQKARWLTLFSIILLALSNGHILFGYQRISINGIYVCDIVGENHLYLKFYRIYDTYVDSIVFVIIPFIIMFICSLLIIVQILETRKNIRYNTKGKFYYFTFNQTETIRKTLKEEGTTRLRDKDIQLCCMLIGTTFAFLALCLPTEINDLFNYTGRNHNCRDWFRKVILMLMQQVYYAGHFYIYTLTGQIFRKHLHAFLCGYNSHRSYMEKENQFLSANIFGNTNNRYQYQPKSKPLLPASSIVNPMIHRPTTTSHEINSIQSNDPSQRLLFDSKHTY